MTMPTTAANKGLAGIVAAETEMSFIDGEKGVLEYVGIPIGELSANSTFEETVFLLWNRRLPSRAELGAFTEELRGRYALPDRMEQRLLSLPKDAHPMHVLRTMVSALSMHDPDPNANDPDSALHKSLNILGHAPTLIAYFDRYRRGLDPVAPDTSLSFSENFLYMLNGERPTPTMARAFDICMILHADHGLNNSTFAARVVISTLSDVYSALTAAIGSLRGPLHGGANEGVMLMLNEIPSLDEVEPYVMQRLANKDKIMASATGSTRPRTPAPTTSRASPSSSPGTPATRSSSPRAGASRRSWSARSPTRASTPTSTSTPRPRTTASASSSTCSPRCSP